MKEKIIQIIRESLNAIRETRFFNTERGYQGELLAEIRNKLRENEWVTGIIVEQEYQKKVEEHGLTIRPDLIIHIPYETSRFNSRSEGNFAVIQLKKDARETEALEDYRKLSDMCRYLKYPLGVFINIDSNNTFLNNYNGDFKDNFIAFAVKLFDGKVILKEERVT